MKKDEKQTVPSEAAETDEETSNENVKSELSRGIGQLQRRIRHEKGQKEESVSPGILPEIRIQKK